MVAARRGTLIAVKAFARSALIAVVVIAGASGCNADRYGAYLHVTSPDPIEQVEFVFGGHFPSPDCQGSIAEVPALRATPTFTGSSPADTMFRRQPSPGDVRKVGGTEYTLYVDTPVNDPDFGFPDELGHALIVIGTTEAGELRVGELDDFDVPTDQVDKYEIPLSPVADQQVEQWGAGEQRCVRYTRRLDNGAVASEYIVPTWDRDCDGFVTQLCGNPADDDCDPLAFCDSSTPGAPNCIVPDGCAQTSGTDDRCELATCVNRGGSTSKECDASRGFCIENAKCSIHDCQRPPLECLATRQSPDVTCHVAVRRVDRPDGTAQVACTGVLPGLLHEGATDTTCQVVEQTPLDEHRHADVTFSTPIAPPGGCDLALDPFTAVDALLPEMRLIVEVSSVIDGSGLLVVAIEPDELTTCDNAPAIKCDDTTAALETCME